MTFAPTCVLVTGGAGFIGSNFIRWLLDHERTVHVINLDALTYAGNLESLDDVVRAHGPQADGRYTFAHGDVRDVTLIQDLLRGRTQGGSDPAAAGNNHRAAQSE